MNNKKTFKEDDPWNGRRLISALAELLIENSSARRENCTDLISKTHQQRIYSVLCAVFDLKYDESKMAHVIGNFVDGEYINMFKGGEESLSVLCKTLSDYSGTDTAKVKEILSGSDGKYVFRELLQSRIASERFSKRYSSMLEGTQGHYLACKVSGKLYACLEKADKEIEDMLIALLGESGKFSIPIHRLIEYYRYPVTTDKELLDYWVDNL